MKILAELRKLNFKVTKGHTLDDSSNGYSIKFNTENPYAFEHRVDGEIGINEAKSEFKFLRAVERGRLAGHVRTFEEIHPDPKFNDTFLYLSSSFQNLCETEELEASTYIEKLNEGQCLVVIKNEDISYYEHKFCKPEDVKFIIDKIVEIHTKHDLIILD